MRGREALRLIKPYVPGKLLEEVEEELGIKGAIKLASNENHLGPSPEAVSAIREAADRVYLYPDSYCRRLRSLLAQRLNVGEDNLIVGNGSDEVLKLVAEAYLDPEDETILGWPSFSEYEFVTHLMAAKPIKVPLTPDLRYDLAAIKARVTPRTKIVFICNPNNPTGTIVTEGEVEEFLRGLPEEVLVVFDEAYYEYVTRADYPDTVKYVRQGRKNILVLRTFSKIYGLAGLRVGYGIGSKELISWISRAKDPFNVNSLAQIAACAALNDRQHIESSVEVNNEGKSYLYRELEKRGWEYVRSEANFILVNVGRNSRTVFEELLREGIVVRTGDVFDLDNWIRVTVGTESMNQRFISALAKVLASPTGR